MTFIANGPARLLALFGAASFAAVALGALTCALSGVPTALWARNLAAWLVGGLAAVGVARAGPRALPLALGIAPALLAATFLGAGEAGVHRWVNLGPIGLNAAMLATPALVVALAAGAGSSWRWAAALAALALTVLQPDASQATALGGAMLLIATMGAGRRSPGRAALAAATAGLVLFAWLRPDPLKPVPEVEEIFALAWGVSPMLAALSLGAVGAAAAVPALAARTSGPPARLAGAALGMCLLLWLATTFAGAFPVPLVGIGVSPILGSWLGVGLLAGLARPGQAPK